MSKKEVISINDNYEYPKSFKDVKSSSYPKSFYKETTKVLKREIVLNQSLTISGQVKQLQSYLQILQTRIEKITVDFLFLKLFSRTASKADIDNYNKDYNDLDKYINRFNKDLEIVVRFFESLDSNISVRKREPSIEEINDIFERIVVLYTYATGLKDDLNSFQKNYFHEFKVASYSLIRNKKISEIKDLTERVEIELNQFKNIELANDFYIYNSGNEICAMINEFIHLKKRDNNKLDFHYFLEYDAIVAFKYMEWVELFIKFNYVLGKIGNSVMYTKEFKTRYRELETRYAIILIYSEIYK